MADNNTLNFDLDAPAVPTLTLDPAPAAAPVEEKKEAPAPAAPEVRLTPEEQAMVDSFAEKIDITNSQQVLQYGSACQKKIGDFSEAALSKVSTKDLGEVGNMITDLIGELKSFDANEEHIWRCSPVINTVTENRPEERVLRGGRGYEAVGSSQIPKKSGVSSAVYSPYKNGRSKIISGGFGEGAALPAYKISVYAAASTPFSSKRIRVPC